MRRRRKETMSATSKDPITKETIPVEGIPIDISFQRCPSVKY